MMCTVQVLLLPEVGVPRRDPPSTLRRRLFAEEEEEEGAAAERRAQFLSALQEDFERRNRDRWNFDFRTERPLPGRYQWVPLRPSATAQPRDSVVKEVARAYGQRPTSKGSSGLRAPLKTTTQSKITGECDFCHYVAEQI